jgi:RNA polymerase sigma-70 factor (ECF subfamily)
LDPATRLPADEPPPAAPDARAQRDAALAELLRAVAAGDARAFEAFYDATIGYARALARRMVRPADLDDLLADAFFQAWREAVRFDPARGSAVTWLLLLVRSRALDLLRHQRAAPDALDTPDPAADHVVDDRPGPDELLGASQAGSLLQHALGGLSAHERWVLGLAYYREMSHSQISETTGLPLGTVKSLILRAQTRLREQLNPHA